MSKRISKAFMMVQKQISIDILESKFQAKCWTSLYRAQRKVKSVNVKFKGKNSIS